MLRFNVEGSIIINFSPTVNSTFFKTLIILIGVSLILKPDERILSTNIFADPSKIGTSSLSISI